MKNTPDCRQAFIKGAVKAVIAIFKIVGINTTLRKTDVVCAVNIILAMHLVDAYPKRVAFLARAGKPIITFSIGCTLSLNIRHIEEERCRRQHSNDKSPHQAGNTCRFSGK
jgi:hypothetical protein